MGTEQLSEVLKERSISPDSLSDAQQRAMQRLYELERIIGDMPGETMAILTQLGLVEQPAWPGVWRMTKKGRALVRTQLRYRGR